MDSGDGAIGAHWRSLDADLEAVAVWNDADAAVITGQLAGQVEAREAFDLGGDMAVQGIDEKREIVHRRLPPKSARGAIPGAPPASPKRLGYSG